MFSPSGGSFQFNFTIFLYRVNKLSYSKFVQTWCIYGPHNCKTFGLKKSGQSDDWIKRYGQKIVILEQFLKMATKWQSFGHNF